MIEDRVLNEAKFVICNRATIRDTAKQFGVSKSTVHLDLSKRLKYINYGLYMAVKQILQYNFSVRHIRGGESTKQKFLTQSKGGNKGSKTKNTKK